MPGFMVTIDDAPHPASTELLLAAFKQFNLTVTFFVIGRNIEAYPDGLKAILAAEQNHRVGNHSMTHPQPFCNLSQSEMVAEWEQCHKVVKDATTFDMEILRTPGGDGWLICPESVLAGVQAANSALGTHYVEIKGAGGDDNPEPDWTNIKQYYDAGTLDQCHEWNTFLSEVDAAINTGVGGNIIFHDSSSSPSAADFMVTILTHIQNKYGLENFSA